MNTERKKVTATLCDKCEEVYLVIGTTPIRQAFPHINTPDRNMDTGQPVTGVCPKHPRGLGYER